MPRLVRYALNHHEEPLAADRRARVTVRNLQALRAIAALMVVCLHMTLPHVGIDDIYAHTQPRWLAIFDYIGTCGVDLFFVISGFIMLVTNWDAFGKPLAGLRFFGRRVIRVYPPYWLATAPVLAVFIFARERFMVSHVGAQTGIVESLLLLPNPHKFVLTVGWTLVYEMIFYVVFAAILGTNRRFVPAAIGVWCLVEIGLHTAFSDSSNFYLAFASSLFPLEFILGTVVGLVYVRGWFPAPRVIATIAVALAASSLGYVISQHVEPGNYERVALFGIPAALLVYGAVALEARGIFSAPRWLAKLGDGSYAVYLWHLSVLVVVRQAVLLVHPTGPVAHAAIIIATAAIVLTVGQLVYRFFELPVTSALNKRFDTFLPLRSFDENRVPRGAAAES